MPKCPDHLSSVWCRLTKVNDKEEAARLRGLYSYRALSRVHQRLDPISESASHHSGRPPLERVAKIVNLDRHTLGDALVVLNPLTICLRY